MGLMGLIITPWAILTVPASLLTAFGFASLGMGITSFLKTVQQMDWINFIMLPMFLFSATFYPLSIYPQYIQWLIQAMPLWHGVELLRQLSLACLPRPQRSIRLLPADDRTGHAGHHRAAAKAVPEVAPSRGDCSPGVEGAPRVPRRLRQWTHAISG
jgi:Zn-dependent protease with chaperone function